MTHFSQIVQFLLQAGGNPMLKTSRSQESALHMAAKNGYADILRVLASACARVRSDGNDDQADPLYFVDENGSTLLHAVTNSHTVAKVFSFDGISPLDLRFLTMNSCIRAISAAFIWFSS